MAACTAPPAADVDLDAVPLRIGIRYSNPSLALDYRDADTGNVQLLQIPLAVTPDSRAADVYADVVRAHPDYLSPAVMSALVSSPWSFSWSMPSVPILP